MTAWILSRFVKAEKVPSQNTLREGARQTPELKTRCFISSLMGFCLEDNIFLPARMTSRRIVSNEKTLFDKDERTRIPSASEKSNITPAVPA